jgi:hypothetical protein
MVSKAAIEDFLAQRRLAIVGVSREGRKFGNMALKELKAKGYHTVPINPHAENIAGERCYPNLNALPEPVGGVVVVVPPDETERVVRDATQAGIQHIWMQQGAESEAAIQFCEEQGINTIHGECILMFAEPTGFGHRLHRWVWGLLGKLPQ